MVFIRIKKYLVSIDKVRDLLLRIAVTKRVYLMLGEGKLKLLFVSSVFQPAWDWGGPVRSLWNLARGLAGWGVEVMVITTNAAQHGIVHVQKDRIEEGVRIITTPVVGRGRWAMANRFGFSHEYASTMIEQIGKNDVIHVQGVWGIVPIEAAILARIFRKPLILSPRGSLDRWPLSQKRVKKQVFLHTFGRFIFGKATGVHFTAEEEMRQAPSWLIKDKGFVVPNPVEFAQKGDPGRFRRRIETDGSAIVVGIIGRIHKIKGFDLLIPAIGKCCRKEIILAVVGQSDDSSGPYKPVVEKMIKDAGIQDRVVFTGMLSGQDLPDAYAGIDVLAVPSYHENFGNVVVEATAQGTPVLVSDQVGLKDWVAKNDVGMVLPLDPEAWAKALEGLRKEEMSQRWDPERLEKLTRDSFSIEAVARQMLREYERILQQQRMI